MNEVTSKILNRFVDSDLVCRSGVHRRAIVAADARLGETRY